MSRRMLLTALLLAVVPAGADAQEWRDMTAFRQRSDETRLDVHVRYGAGELLIRRGEPGELYRMNLRYDADIFDPVSHYEAGELEVGVEGRESGLKLRNAEAGELRLQLSPEVPLDLDLDFGAVEADLDLSGLRVSSLDVETGASGTEVRFGEPNPAACDRIDVTMGAAGFEARGLGNAGCRHLTLEGGVGEVTLDFGGEWSRDLDAEVTMALGSVTLVIPEDVGVRVEKETFLTDFDRSDFDERDGSYYSDSWAGATHRLTLRMKGAFGSVSVRWAPPATPGTP